MSNRIRDIEQIVILGTIGAFGVMAAGYDFYGLALTFLQDGLLGLGRGLSAVALGWMCGWYFTLKCQPTSSFLLQSVLSLSGHLVALITAVLAAGVMIAIDLIGTDPDKATYLSLTAVTFAPVSAWFATQLQEDRSVHLVTGFGIGALAYIVVIGIPG